jgi:acetyl-CoA acetyltransferase
MNVELAMMALEGLAKAPVTVTHDGANVIIEGSPSSLKEIARLFLLLGGGSGDEFDLQPGVHVTAGSPRVVMRAV